MSSPWPRMPFSEAVEVNPRRPVARGTLAPFVDMAALPAETRGVRPCRVRPVGGGGSRFTNGDTLFARITPCTENGKTGLVDCLSTGEVATGSTEFIVLGPCPNVTLPRFIYYLAKNPAFRSFAISRMRGTSGRQRVPVNVFADFEVGVPRLPEQRKIAAILSSVDDAIEKTQAVIDQVQVVKRGLMQELLTRGLPGRHTRFKQTEIGTIPWEWELKKLSEVASVQTGLAKTRGGCGHGERWSVVGTLRSRSERSRWFLGPHGNEGSERKRRRPVSIPAEARGRLVHGGWRCRQVGTGHRMEWRNRTMPAPEPHFCREATREYPTHVPVTLPRKPQRQVVFSELLKANHESCFHEQHTTEEFAVACSAAG